MPLGVGGGKQVDEHIQLQETFYSKTPSRLHGRA